VVIDTSPAKTAVADWAKELLPPDRYFVAWTPTINHAYLHENVFGIEAAHKDLFQDCLIFITAPPSTTEPALKLASDLTTLVGAKPYFADQAEVDGLVAASTVLPQLTAAALLNAVIDQPGWREGRKLAGRPFAHATIPILSMEGQKNIAQSAIVNRDNVLRVIDNLIGSLKSIRESIQDGDVESLQNWMQHAVESRQTWIDQRKQNNWANVDNPQPPLPTAGEVLGRLISFGRPKPPPKKKQ